MISLQDVSVRFGQKPCVQGVSLELEGTGAVALIGPNGAGKTTLLRAIAGLQEAEGKVVMDGADVSGLSVKERAQKLTYLGNSEEVVFDFSALECVLMAVAAGRGFFELESETDVAKARQALAALGVDHVADQALNTLSSGERQRVWIARTLLKNAPVWLLDEPTSNLDIKYQRRVLEFFKEESRERLVVAVMHDLNALAGFFERVVLMHEGRIVADGPPSDVLEPAILEPVYGTRIQRLQADGRLAILW